MVKVGLGLSVVSTLMTPKKDRCSITVREGRVRDRVRIMA